MSRMQLSHPEFIWQAQELANMIDWTVTLESLSVLTEKVGHIIETCLVLVTTTCFILWCLVKPLKMSKSALKNISMKPVKNQFWQAIVKALVLSRSSSLITSLLSGQRSTWQESSSMRLHSLVGELTGEVSLVIMGVDFLMEILKWGSRHSECLVFT